MRILNSSKSFPRSKSPGKFSLDAFTLVELLVMMAVTALFALILRPALSGDLEMQRRAECLDNLRKLGQAMSAYAADYDGYYPHALRLTDTRQLRSRSSDYFGRSALSVLLVEGYAGESGEVFRCPSYVPVDEVLDIMYPVYRDGRWVRSSTGTELTTGIAWRAYNVYAGYVQHSGGDPEIISEWHLGSPAANPFPHYRVAVKNTHPGRKVLAGDKARGTWDVTTCPDRGHHLDAEGGLAGANFLYNDGSASWTPFTGYNYEHLAHYSAPANRGHTAGWERVHFFYLPGPVMDAD